MVAPRMPSMIACKKFLTSTKTPMSKAMVKSKKAMRAIAGPQLSPLESEEKAGR